MSYLKKIIILDKAKKKYHSFIQSDTNGKYKKVSQHLLNIVKILEL